MVAVNLTVHTLTTDRIFRNLKHLSLTTIPYSFTTVKAVMNSTICRSILTAGLGVFCIPVCCRAYSPAPLVASMILLF